jgi:hypothetical protein
MPLYCHSLPKLKTQVLWAGVKHITLWLHHPVPLALHSVLYPKVFCVALIMAYNIPPSNE